MVFFLILFILIGGLLLYHIVMIFAIHQYESVIGVQCPVHPESPPTSLLTLSPRLSQSTGLKVTFC